MLGIEARLAAREFEATSRRKTLVMMTGSKLVALAITTAITVLSTVSYAGDATWLSCKGIATYGDKAPRSRMYLVASLVEHRAADGASRDLDVTLIKGGNVSLGTIHGDQSGALEVRNVTDKHPITFTGTAQLTEDMKIFTLTGKLDITFGTDPKAK
ncbi:MAG TPA: hypothetical protein VK571_06460, partial [Gemmatimonadaceae bacterium]|nr:hypothetical protein [Gemmatimonadaceae bacterium]